MLFKDRRLIRFTVSTEMINLMSTHLPTANRIFRDLIILDAKQDYCSGSIEYTAYYKHADIVPEGCMATDMIPRFTKEDNVIKVSWEKI